MKVQIDYLVKENLCIKAIDDFKNLSFVLDWLNSNKELFESINYGPEGLPKITNSHFDGVTYEKIKQFTNLYRTINSLV